MTVTQRVLIVGCCEASKAIAKKLKAEIIEIDDLGEMSNLPNGQREQVSRGKGKKYKHWDKRYF